MEKKSYIKPDMGIITMSVVNCIADVTAETGNGDLGYGGPDLNGIIDPEGNFRDDWEAFWDDRE